jgi:hypothetical protein
MHFESDWICSDSTMFTTAPGQHWQSHMFGNSTKMVKTGSPNLECTELPKHYRRNKALKDVFRVRALADVPDGTRVRWGFGVQQLIHEQTCLLKTLSTSAGDNQHEQR